MPTYSTAKDVLSMSLPNAISRKAFVNSPRSETFGDILIPEATFNRGFTRSAINLQYQAKRMELRNKLVRGVTTNQETYATLQLVKAGELEAEPEYNFEDFLLQSSQEATQEKYQLVETFGETVGFFFGSRPKVYNYSGTLLNTQDYPWRDNWKTFYETKLRGTKLVEEKRRAYLTYDYVLREGYILSTSMADNAAKPNCLDFNFVMFITKEVNIGPQVDVEREVTELTESTTQAAQEVASQFKAIGNGILGNFKNMWQTHVDTYGHGLIVDDNGMSANSDPTEFLA